MSKFGKVFVCFIMAFAMILVQVSCTGGFFIHDSSSESTGIVTSTSESTATNSSADSVVNANFNIDYSEVELEKSEAALVVENIRPSVIEVHCVTKTGTSSGSGVILSFDDTDGDGVNDVALVVTCHHVIDGAISMAAKSIFGDKYDLAVMGSDPVSDIGILQMKKGDDGDFSKLTHAKMFTASDKLIVGSDVFAIGNPLGYLGGTVTKGVISALNRDVTVEDKKMTLIQTDAAINGGNSGGGLFDAATGALIGIVNAGYASSAAQGLSFAIPCGTVKYIIDQLQDHGYIEGNYEFGATFATQLFGSMFNSKTYVVIKELDIYGTFSKGGLKAGDVIFKITIGDKSFDASNYDRDTLTKLSEFLESGEYKIGDEVTVEYARDTLDTGNYTKGTISFKIAQYRYGVI